MRVLTLDRTTCGDFTSGFEDYLIETGVRDWDMVGSIKTIRKMHWGTENERRRRSLHSGLKRVFFFDDPLQVVVFYLEIVLDTPRFELPDMSES